MASWCIVFRKTDSGNSYLIAVPSLHINIFKQLLLRRMKISCIILFSAGLVSRWVNLCSLDICDR